MNVTAIVKEALLNKSAWGIFGIFGAVFVFMGLVSWSGILESWELNALDVRYALSHRLSPPHVSKELLLVKIDRKCEGQPEFGEKRWYDWTLDDWLVPLASALTADVKDNSIGVLIQLNRGSSADEDLAWYVPSAKGHLFPAWSEPLKTDR